MDDSRFDQLARALANRRPRRSLLGGAIGAVVGAIGLRQSQPTLARSRGANGTPCSSPRDCASGLCVDGVCCDGSCLGTCEACNLNGAEGICTPVAGQPVGNRGPCPGDGGICSGSCDGVTASNCAGYPGGDTACGAVTCANGFASGGVCSGNGSCIQTTTHCGLYSCAADGSGCLTTCAGDSDCTGDAYCVDGVCQGDLALGSACDRIDQCQTGRCVDGYCCDQACDEVCHSCGADGFCAKDPDDDWCAESSVCCRGDCVELGTEAHCRSCHDVCANGETCCGDAGCIDLETDVEHCGACGHACGADDVCCGGACTQLGTPEHCLNCNDHCADGQDCCGEDGCVTFDNDPEHCGTCDNVCIESGVCTDGTCGCAPGTRLCEGVCLSDDLCCTDDDCDIEGKECIWSSSCGENGICDDVPTNPGFNCDDNSNTPDGSEMCNGLGQCVSTCDSSVIVESWGVSERIRPDGFREMAAHFAVFGVSGSGPSPVLSTFYVREEVESGVTGEYIDFAATPFWDIRSEYYIVCHERSAYQWIFSVGDACVQEGQNNLTC